MLGIMPKGAMKYAFMPEIGVRFRALFFGGFGYVPYFLAVVYQMVGLLPQRHPYLSHANIGRYGLRHVVAEASRHITFSWKTVDQVILFFAVLVGLVVFGLQILALLAMIFMQPAMALPTSWTGFFFIQNPLYKTQDLANMMLDMVFGVPYPGLLGVSATGATGFFESCVSSPAPCLDNFGTPVYQWTDAGGGTNSDMNVAAGGDFNPAHLGPLASNSHTYFPFPYHLGIHRLLAIYSNGLLVVAMLITSYFVATILAETAQSGIPFGRRFNKTWAPLRIVVAFGLLIPTTTGLNSSQYVVLYAAKYGSAFASNGWRYFNDTLTSSFFGGDQNLISQPNLPEYKQLTQFLFTAQVCKTAWEYYRLVYEKKEDGTVTDLTDDDAQRIFPRIVGPHSGAAGERHLRIDPGTDYDDAMFFLPGGDDGNVLAESMTIRFGTYSVEENSDDRSNIAPICGELQLPLTETRFGAFGVNGPMPGPDIMQEAYFNLIRDFWFSAVPFAAIPPFPLQTPAANRRDIYIVKNKIAGAKAVLDPSDLHNAELNSTFVASAVGLTNTLISAQVLAAQTAQELTLTADATLAATVASPLYQKGWAAAGIWYNRVAEMNGSMTNAVFAKPVISLYPEIMERISSVKAKYNEDTNNCYIYKPEVTGIDSPGILLDGNNGLEYANVLWTAFDGWGGEGGCTDEDKDGNIVLSAIKSILGVDGLYALRKNDGTHPLAMLSGVGRSLVESSIRSVGYAVAVSGGAAFGVLPKKLANVSASFFVSVAMMGLIVGFVLFYVVPFLPFIYFFFAVGGWIKGIFEALVGAPLWALAHIRIDGDGLPGSAALNGYFLIFEVFLRPILVVFGLLAGISIYAALVDVLNSIFTLVVSNLGGFDISEGVGAAPEISIEYMRSLIDEFFFTVIYAMLVYMIGMSSFKLIDTIPNNILRWMGQSVATFGDQRENPAETLVSKASIGSQQAVSKIGGGLQQAVGAATKE